MKLNTVESNIRTKKYSPTRFFFDESNARLCVADTFFEISG